MTLHQKSAYDLPHRRKPIDSYSDTDIEKNSRPEPCGSTALQHQGISKLNYSHGAYSDDPTEPTKILHQGKDDMPAITLTAYKDDALPWQSLLQLHLKVVPDHDESIVNCVEDLATNRSAQLDDQDENLIRDLGVHFEVLKSEFEERTGRAWTPLRAWEKDDGEWDWVSEEEEEGDGEWVVMNVMEG